MKPFYVYLWRSLHIDIDTYFRQTLDEFSEIQKLSREVLYTQSANSSHSSLLRNVRRQSHRSWLRSWRALRALLKRFCCLTSFTPAIYCLSGWPGYQLWSKETGGAKDHQPKSWLSSPLWCPSCCQILWKRSVTKKEYTSNAQPNGLSC